MKYHFSEVHDPGKILVNERLVVRLQLLNVGYDGALGVQVVLAASITVVYYLHTDIPAPT